MHSRGLKLTDTNPFCLSTIFFFSIIMLLEVKTKAHSRGQGPGGEGLAGKHQLEEEG